MSCSGRKTWDLLYVAGICSFMSNLFMLQDLPSCGTVFIKRKIFCEIIRYPYFFVFILLLKFLYFSCKFTLIRPDPHTDRYRMCLLNFSLSENLSTESPVRWITPLERFQLMLSSGKYFRQVRVRRRMSNATCTSWRDSRYQWVTNTWPDATREIEGSHDKGWLLSVLVLFCVYRT